MAPDPDQPAACLPGEEPLIDLDTLSEATKLLIATVPPPSDDCIAPVAASSAVGGLAHNGTG